MLEIAGGTEKPVCGAPAQSKSKFRRCYGRDIRAARPLPMALRQSATFDRGTEFVAFRTLRSELGDEQLLPRNEIALANGQRRERCQIRRFLPSDTDIAAMDARFIHTICAQHNSYRPNPTLSRFNRCTFSAESHAPVQVDLTTRVLSMPPYFRAPCGQFGGMRQHGLLRSHLRRCRVGSGP